MSDALLNIIMQADTRSADQKMQATADKASAIAKDTEIASKKAAKDAEDLQKAAAAMKAKIAADRAKEQAQQLAEQQKAAQKQKELFQSFRDDRYSDIVTKRKNPVTEKAKERNAEVWKDIKELAPLAGAAIAIPIKLALDQYDLAFNRARRITNNIRSELQQLREADRRISDGVTERGEANRFKQDSAMRPELVAEDNEKQRKLDLIRQMSGEKLAKNTELQADKVKESTNAWQKQADLLAAIDLRMNKNKQTLAEIIDAQKQSSVEKGVNLGADKSLDKTRKKLQDSIDADENRRIEVEKKVVKAKRDAQNQDEIHQAMLRRVIDEEKANRETKIQTQQQNNKLLVDELEYADQVKTALAEARAERDRMIAQGRILSDQGKVQNDLVNELAQKEKELVKRAEDKAKQQREATIDKARSIAEAVDPKLKIENERREGQKAVDMGLISQKQLDKFIRMMEPRKAPAAPVAFGTSEAGSIIANIMNGLTDPVVSEQKKANQKLDKTNTLLGKIQQGGGKVAKAKL